MTLIALPVLIRENKRTGSQAAAPVAVLAPGGQLNPAQQLAVTDSSAKISAYASGRRSQDGMAAFHRHDAALGARSCFHASVAIGTIITVTNSDSGAQTTCVVQGRAPLDRHRVIDLDPATFGEIADLAEGAVPVRLSW